MAPGENRLAKCAPVYAILVCLYPRLKSLDLPVHLTGEMVEPESGASCLGLWVFQITFFVFCNKILNAAVFHLI